jgi:hypothetical protein
MILKMAVKPKSEDLMTRLLASRKFLKWRPNRGRWVTIRRGQVHEPNCGLEQALEKHYSPTELSERWGLSVDTIREIFQGEPGVLVIERPQTKYKRRYRTFRVPESVAVRVHNRLVAKARC